MYSFQDHLQHLIKDYNQMRLILQFQPAAINNLTFYKVTRKSDHSTQDIVQRIFRKAQMAAKQNAHNFQHRFPAQFLILFHMMWSVFVLTISSRNQFLIGWKAFTANEKFPFQS